ncbi:MAG: hypothetical protein K1W04_08695 [Oscillospiraceae bacterium]
MLEEYDTRWATFVRAAELRGENGGYPTLVLACPAPDRDNALALTVKNVSPPELDQVVVQLQEYLDGIVADLSFGETINETRFLLIPSERGRTSEGL